MTNDVAHEGEGAPATPARSERGAWGCLRRLALGCAVASILGCCAGSVLAVLALRSETGQAAIVSWALVEGHDGIVIALSDSLIERAPDEWQHYRRKALSLRRSGRHEESFAVYRQAIEALPELWWPHSHLCFYGSLYSDPAGVLHHCDRALELSPSEPAVAYFRRSLARALVGDIEAAAVDMAAAQDALAAEASESERDAERLAEQAIWLESLEAGRNPFDEPTLEALRTRFFGPPR